MFLKLKEARTVKGTNHQEGACLEVSDHLGGQMLLNSIAVKTSRESVLEYSKVAESKRIDDDAKCKEHTQELTKMKEKDLNKLGKEIDGFDTLSQDEKISKLMEIFRDAL